MSRFYNNYIIRHILWLILLGSHSIFVLSYFIFIQPETKFSETQTEHCYYINSDITAWINNSQSERTFTFQLIRGTTLILFLFATPRIIPSYRYLSSLFSFVVRVNRLSPTYIINRVLII